MKNTPILILLGCVAASLSAQTSTALGGHGRFQTFHNSDTNFPASIDYNFGLVDLGNGSPSFGVGTGDIFTYSQVVQIDVTRFGVGLLCSVVRYGLFDLGFSPPLIEFQFARSVFYWRQIALLVGPGAAWAKPHHHRTRHIISGPAGGSTKKAICPRRTN